MKPPAKLSILFSVGLLLVWGAMNYLDHNYPDIPEFHNPGVSPLAYWDEAFKNCRNQVVGINVYGDSRALSANRSGTDPTFPAPLSARWVNRLAVYAQASRACGSHGSGIIPFRYGTGTFSSQGLNAYYYGTTSSLSNFTTADIKYGPHQGPDSMAITAINPVTISLAPQRPDGSGPLPYDHIRMFCTGGMGFNAWTIYIDNSVVGACGGGTGAETPVVTTSSAFKLASHEGSGASVVCPTAPCTAYGMKFISGTTGLEINNLSVGGASAEVFGQYPSSQYAFENLDPDAAQLHIIEEVTNEPFFAGSPSQFQTTLKNMITHARRPTHPSSVLLVAPTVDSVSGTSRFYPIITSTALASNSALVDMRDRWGGGPAPSFLFASDHIHENPMGNSELYSAVAAMIFHLPGDGDAVHPLGH